MPTAGVWELMKAFLDKLIERLDKLDPQSLQTQFLRLAQERGLLETIFQSIQEGVLVISRTGRIQYANRAAGHLIGFTPDQARGKLVSRYLRDIDWDRLLDFDEEEWSRLITQEIEITYPEHRFLSFYVVPLQTADDQGEGVVVILRDVTRDRENEATMLESERLNAVKLLAAGVAHEIGNPLNALDIHLQLLDREIRHIEEDDAQSLGDLVSVARNEVARLDVIITQFLRAIRPTQPKTSPTRIENVLKETLTLLREEIQNRKIEVEISVDNELPKIRIDKDQIKRAFFNVMRNAFQAMPDGGSLQITLSTSDRYLVVSFKDTGAGISPENLGRIFEPYHTTKTEGSGLGLMIVQRIVQDHGGRIDVMSKEGEGTNFVIYLPLAERRVRLLKAPDNARRTAAPGAAEDDEGA